MRALSLRTRLVAVAVALVAFGVAATCVATYYALRGFLYERLDDDLTSVGSADICLDPAHPKPSALAPDIELALVDATGAAVDPGCVQVVPPLDVDARDLSHMIANLGEPMTVQLASGGEVRAIARPVRVLGFDAVPAARYAVIGKSTREVSSTLGKLLGLELIGGAGLDRRVPESDPGTEVGQLAEAVNTMLDAVEREYSARWASEQRMRRFLADASHELRTPLTSLRGYAELIRLRGGDGFGAEARDSLRRIESEGTRMSGLVDDLLTLARSDRGVAVERAPVDLAEVVRDAVADLRAAYPEREVGLDAAGPLPEI